MAPDASVHAALAASAANVRDSLATCDSCRSWKITLLFYEAMHRVEGALLAPRDLHARSHAQRDILLINLEEEEGLAWLARLRAALIEMRSRSVLARYEEAPEGWRPEDVEMQTELLQQIISQIAASP
jgi:hypothetical protein